RCNAAAPCTTPSPWFRWTEHGARNRRRLVRRARRSRLEDLARRSEPRGTGAAAAAAVAGSGRRGGAAPRQRWRVRDRARFRVLDAGVVRTPARRIRGGVLGARRGARRRVARRVRAAVLGAAGAQAAGG